jgi:hypothetical protein
VEATGGLGRVAGRVRRWTGRLRAAKREAGRLITQAPARFDPDSEPELEAWMRKHWRTSLFSADARGDSTGVGPGWVREVLDGRRVR